MEVNATPSTLVKLGAGQTALLRPGQVLQGLIEGDGGELWVRLGPARLELPEGAVLKPGTAVSAEVLRSGEGIQLRLTPTATSAPAPASAPASTSEQGGLSDLLFRVLDTLGGVSVPAEAAGALVSANLPQTEEAVRALVALFVNRGTMGSDLAEIVALVNAAVAEGALAEGGGGDFSALAARLSVPEAEQDFAQLLRQLADGQARPLEAKLAALVRANRESEIPAALRGDLRAQLTRLLGDEGLRGHLRNMGQDRAFEAAAGRVLERLAGAQLQNLRALEQPYAFLELPVLPGGALRHGQVHFWAEGRKGRGNAGESTAVALDLSMSHLGDLWISLRTTAGHCACRLLTVSEAAASAIEGAAEELVEALRESGYARATVSVGRWEGDRLSEVAKLMQRFSGMDVQA